MEEKKCNCKEPYDAELFEGGYPYCPVHDKAPELNHDRVIANQVAGMPLEEAIFQDGYSAGYDAGYEKGNREATTRTGAAWVKADKNQPANSNLVHLQYGTGHTDFKLTGYYEPSEDKWRRQDGKLLDWAPNLEWLDESPAAAREEVLQRIKDFNLSDVDAPVFTHTKEFRAHFSYIKGRLMDIIRKYETKQQKENP